METLTEYLPFLLPLIIFQFALTITALVHIFRHPHYQFGNKIIWIIVVLLFQIIGSLVYFIFGRGEE